MVLLPGRLSTRRVLRIPCAASSNEESVAAFVNEDAFKAVMIAKQLKIFQPLLLNYLLDLETRQLSTIPSR